MKKILKFIFKGKKQSGKYSDFSDFFRHASSEEKTNLITEVAQKANEDQSKLYNEARLKLKSN